AAKAARYVRQYFANRPAAVSQKRPTTGRQHKNTCTAPQKYVLLKGQIDDA
ncbi:MAG: hypothetical protein JWN41_1524, partial [Thermoleophilia bacterium]|nr:hypothetical protein [Thermoleophilia bacterium]